MAEKPDGGFKVEVQGPGDGMQPLKESSDSGQDRYKYQYNPENDDSSDEENGAALCLVTHKRGNKANTATAERVTHGLRKKRTPG